jgi:hypothetical protein
MTANVAADAGRLAAKKLRTMEYLKAERVYPSTLIPFDFDV